MGFFFDVYKNRINKDLSLQIWSQNCFYFVLKSLVVGSEDGTTCGRVDRGFKRL